MADRTLFPARIVAPEGVVFEGEVQELDVPSLAGGMGILARHAPIVADLKPGVTRVRVEDGSWRTWATAEGFAQTAGSRATVLVEETVESTKVDVEEADRIIAEATARLDEAGDDVQARTAATKAIAWGELLKRVADQYGE